MSDDATHTSELMRPHEVGSTAAPLVPCRGAKEFLGVGQSGAPEEFGRSASLWARPAIPPRIVTRRPPEDLQTVPTTGQNGHADRLHQWEQHVTSLL